MGFIAKNKLKSQVKYSPFRLILAQSSSGRSFTSIITGKLVKFAATRTHPL
ncbi:hypothetical protein EBCG_03305 [Escherichia marmotae]|nr:hypothetical protein EBCG_03305 [Escherichia marmotae]